MKVNPIQVVAVDDEAEILDVLESVIQSAGGHAVCFTSAIEAVGYIEANREAVSLVLSDYNMPSMNGVAFRVKTFELLPDVPFLFLSGYVTDEMRSMGEELKVSAFIDKPFDFANLQGIVRRELASRLRELEYVRLVDQTRVDEAERAVDALLQSLLNVETCPVEVLEERANDAAQRVAQLRSLFGLLGSQVAVGLCHKAEDVLRSLGEDASAQARGSLTSYVVKVADGLQDCVWAMRKRTETETDISALLSSLDALAPPPRGSRDESAADAPRDANRGNGNKPKDAAKGGKSKVDAKGETIRVPTTVLDEFIELAGENTVLRNMVNRVVKAIESELPGNRHVTLLAELLDEMYKTNSRMHSTVELMRKVPVGNLWRGFPRTIRDLTVQLGKEVDLETGGDELLVDSSVSSTLGDCLVHLLRNSLDHGLESPTDRVAKGKPPRGVVRIRATAAEEELRLVLSDDGRGIDAARIAEKVVEKGLATAAQVATMSAERIVAFVFEPGFSTAAAVTDVSGRGVGMDFVRSTIEGLGGRISIDTRPGEGTSFTLVVPEAKGVRILNALMVEAAGHTFALPQANIEGVRVVDATHRREAIEEFRGSLVFRSRGLLLSLVDLRSAIGGRPALKLEEIGEHDELHVVVLRGESAVFAVLVDSIVDTEEIVVKPLPAHLAHMKVYLGATFLGVDGVCPVFDIEGLASTFGITQPDKHAYREGAGETPAGLEAALSASAKTAPGMAETGMAETGRAASALSFREILTFTLSGQASFAIDVPHVFRLEEVPASQVRFQFGSPVMVYRGETLPIILLEKSLVPTVARGFDAKAWLAAQTVLNLIVVEHLGRHAALVVGSIGEYRASEAPLDTSLARGDFAGCLDLGGTLATVLDVGRLLERLGVVQPEAQKPPPDVVPLVSSAAPQFAPAFDANGIAQDDGIVWVDVG